MPVVETRGLVSGPQTSPKIRAAPNGEPLNEQIVGEVFFSPASGR